jgi:hypothetical protein
VGEMICRSVGDGVVIERADETICCSKALLEQADPLLVERDGDLVTFTADNGSWTYEITGWDPQARWYLMRQVRAS